MMISQQEEKETIHFKLQQLPQENNLKKIFIEPNNILIIGKKRSGKTALGWKIAYTSMCMGGRKLYTFMFPKPELLNELPFKVEGNITTMKSLHNLTDSVVIIDEAHRYFDVLNKKVNDDLRIILSSSGQNNTSFIFITHNSFFITRGLFSYIDTRIIKEVNEGHWNMERPHMKALYSDTFIEGKESFYIDSDYCRGRERFDKPDWYSDKLSVAYRNESTHEIDFFEKVSQ